jgi:PASTA domain
VGRPAGQYGLPAGYPQGQFGAATPYPHAGPPAKKPFHKRPWVLVVAGLLLLGAISNAVDGDQKDPAASSSVATSSSASTPSIAAPTTPAEEPQAIAPPATAAPTTPAAPVVDFPMPDLVGLDLQTAQNLVQDNGVWLSVSHDLRGSRNQVLDSNWIVCDQNVPPGQRVTGDVEGAIDFGVVKREESCP